MATAHVLTPTTGADRTWSKLRREIEERFDSLLEKVRERRESLLRELRQWEESLTRTRASCVRSLEAIRRERDEMVECLAKLKMNSVRTSMEKAIKDLDNEISDKEKTLSYPRVRFVCEGDGLDLNISKFGSLVKEDTKMLVRNYTELSKPVNKEEPSKLIGVTKSRPKGPAKRPQSRGARRKRIETSSEDFGNFFTEPTGESKFPIPISIIKARKKVKSAGLFPLGSDSDEYLFSLSASKPVEQKPKQSDPFPGNPLTHAPDKLPSTQRISKEKPKNSIKSAPAPKDNLFDYITEDAGEPLRAKTSVGRTTDFLKELNKAMEKGFVRGQPVIKNMYTAAFEDEGELFSNTGPKGAQREPMGVERGASGIGGYGAPEEPSKLIGVTKSRPKGPAKRPQSRDARKKKIEASSEDFGNFFTEPTDIPKVEPDRLFNGDLGGGLFLGPADTSYQIRAHAKTQPDIETDILFSGNPNKLRLNAKYDVEEELFPENSHLPVKFHSSKVKFEEDHMAPVLPDANKQAFENPLEYPEDLFASVALPKAMRSSKSCSKQITIPASSLNQAPVEPKPNDNYFEENSVLQKKSKKMHKIVKRRDKELFGGDDLFDDLFDVSIF